jgi:hypothetical protein
VVIEDGKIFDVVRSPRYAELPSECREVPGFVCPGFIDLQINGAFGVDVGPYSEALEVLRRELPKTGVTSFLPTAISWPPERYADFLGAIREATSSSGAVILGAHIEGPFLSLAQVRPRFGQSQAGGPGSHGKADRLGHGSHDDLGARASQGEGSYSAPPRGRCGGERWPAAR